MAALFLAVVAAIEIARRLPLFAAFRQMARSGARARRLIRRRASERRKERAMRALSARSLRESLFAGLLLVAVAAPILIVLLLDHPLQLGAISTLFDWSARLALLLLCVAYALLRSWIGRRIRRR